MRNISGNSQRVQSVAPQKAKENNEIRQPQYDECYILPDKPYIQGEDLPYVREFPTRVNGRGAVIGLLVGGTVGAIAAFAVFGATEFMSKGCVSLGPCSANVVQPR